MTTNPTITYETVRALGPELPALVGPADWPAVAAELDALHAAWADAAAPAATAAADVARLRLAARYRVVLAPYAAARERLFRAEGGLSLYDDVLGGVAALLAGLGDADGAARAAELRQAGERRILFLKAVGEPAKSVKLDNLEFDFGALSLAAAGILGAVATLADPTTSGLALGAAVLLILHELYQMMEREVSVDDASVYWGLVQAGGASKQAGLPATLAATNAARAAAHLEGLTEQELRRALLALERMKSIEQVEGVVDVWRVIEVHRGHPVP
jgi:hypothetical protein